MATSWGTVRDRSRRGLIGRLIGAAGIATLAIGSFAAPVGAADDLLVIPIRDVLRGAEGDVISIGSVAVPDDLIGATCQVSGKTVNQQSVHAGNDLLITTAGQTFIVPDFEDAGFVTHEAGETEALGTVIELAVRLGPDGLSSGGFSVSIDCELEPEPTTTTPPVTELPTTELPTTESTDVQVTEPTAPPTTAPPTTPDTEPAAPTAPPTTEAPTTVVPTTEEPPAGPTTGEDVSPTLPVTGSPTGLIVASGLVLIGAGLAARRLANSGIATNDRAS